MVYQQTEKLQLLFFLLFLLLLLLVSEEIEIMTVEGDDQERDVHHNNGIHLVHSEQSHCAKPDEGTNHRQHANQSSVHVRVIHEENCQKRRRHVAEAGSSLAEEERVKREVPCTRVRGHRHRIPEQEREEDEHP